MTGANTNTDGETQTKVLVPVSGKVVGEHEIKHMTAAAKELVLTGGPWAAEFEKQLGQFIGRPHVSLTNSGSSSNLLALSALTSPQIPEKYRLKPDDFIIAAATSFPTTVAPIYQVGCKPVYVDIELGTYNVDIERLKLAVEVWKPRVIMLAHTLGNPFDLDAVMQLCHDYEVWLIEDNCDALGAEWRGHRTGAFGIYSTSSFYPAHHITTGEGGAVVSFNGRYKKILNSFRDWGRDCWCLPGKQNTCNKRFEHQMGELPYGYDHKYIYSHLGYNMKMTEMQAACGVAQMGRLERFIEVRRANFAFLHEQMQMFDSIFILPKWDERSNPSWFGYPITLRDGLRFSRTELTGFLEDFGVMTRNIFGGNIMRQPAFMGLRKIGRAEEMPVAEKVMKDSFWVGVWPGLSDLHMSYIVDTINHFLRANP